MPVRIMRSTGVRIVEPAIWTLTHHSAAHPPRIRVHTRIRARKDHNDVDR